MLHRDAQFYDLVARGLGDSSYQEFVETLFADKYNTPQTDGFKWDDEIQTDFEYKQLTAEHGIYAMATYVDVDSAAPYRSLEGMELKTGTVPRFKHGFALNEKTIRQQMILLQEFEGKFTKAMNEAVNKLLFNSTDQLLGGNYNTLTYQRHQAISKGKLELLDANNPQGIRDITFGFAVPDKNITKLSGTRRWWTDDAMTTEGTAATPIADLKERVKWAKDRNMPVGHFEVDKTLWDAFLEHSKVRTVVGYWFSPLVTSDAQALQVGSNLEDDEIKRRVEKHIGLPIKVIDSVVAVEKYNRKDRKVERTPIRAFDNNAFVLVPNGDLGTIKAVKPIVISGDNARIALYDGGRTVLTQTFDTAKKIQYIESELTALTVPNKSQYFVYLTVK